jgi:folate-binding Fe-S cluster repair protein YgfZ/Tfp pilus assembly protein PilF
MWRIFFSLNMFLSKKLQHIRYGQVHHNLNLSCLKLNGRDTASFLNKQTITNLVQLQDHSFHSTALLDISGRILSHFLLLKENDYQFNILVQAEFIEQTLERLEKFLISEDVQIIRSDDSYYAIWGLVESYPEGFHGRLYNEDCCITKIPPKHLESITKEDLDLMRFFSGEPILGEEISSGDLLTNTFLVNTDLSLKKGCYPGQETVSKILNNKGAAYFPVCLRTSEEYKEDIIRIGEKKIGTIKKKFKIDNQYYYYANVTREYQVNNLEFEVQGIAFQVKYFPLYSNDMASKVADLYYSAIDEFQKDHIEEAIKQLELVIKLDPNYEDAYESLGVIYGRIGDNHKAIKLMQKLATINPLSVMAHTNLSLYYMKIGDKETAENHKALATLKQFEVLGLEAEKKEKEKQRQQQEQAEQVRKEGMFKAVLEIDDMDALANFGLGEIEYNRGNYMASEKYLNCAIKTDPKYSVAYLALAKTLKASAQLDKLKEVIKKGIEVATKNGDLMPANEMQVILSQLK